MAVKTGVVIASGLSLIVELSILITICCLPEFTRICLSRQSLIKFIFEITEFMAGITLISLMLMNGLNDSYLSWCTLQFVSWSFGITFFNWCHMALLLTFCDQGYMTYHKKFKRHIFIPVCNIIHLLICRKHQYKHKHK